MAFLAVQTYQLRHAAMAYLVGWLASWAAQGIFILLRIPHTYSQVPLFGR